MADFHVTRVFTSDDRQSRFEDLKTEFGRGETRVVGPRDVLRREGTTRERHISRARDAKRHGSIFIEFG